MNMVVIQAVEVKLAQGEQDEVRTELGRNTLGRLMTITDNIVGRILLKGDNVTLIQEK